MYTTVRGLVLRVTDYKERDALLTLLTADQGKLTVKARGLRRKNSPLIAPCQLLAYGEFTIFSYRGMNTVNEAASIELFQGLRRDICKLTLATYFAQVAELVSQEDVPNPQLLSLVLNCFHGLSKLNEPEAKVKAVFELRCACLSGYGPDLAGCFRCGSGAADRFDISAGRLECSGCRSLASDGLRMPVSAAVLDAMRYIAGCPDKRLFSFQTGEETLQSLCQITECYLTTQLERGFSALDFYKSLLLT